MKLNHLIGILKGGNKALERKLSSVLSEDCNIVEYTDDAVLFTQGPKLILARVNNAVTESAFAADNITEVEQVYINKKDIQAELVEGIQSVISDLAEEKYVEAREKMTSVQERFYQYGVLKNLYPNLFVEEMSRHSKGFPLRKKAVESIPGFRGAVYSSAILSESADVDVVSMLETLSKYGTVLALGRNKVSEIVLESLKGKEDLAHSYVNALYEMAHDMPDANEDLDMAMDNGYDLESGAYPTEDMDDVNNEDYNMPTDDEMGMDSEGEMDQPAEFEPFDPKKLTPEETRELHVNTLKSILGTIRDFVVDKSNDPMESNIDVDMDTKISDDIAKLDDMNIADDEIADIEARWNPVITFFLDSDVHQTEETDEFSLPAEAEENPELTGEAEPVSNVGGGEAVEGEQPVEGLPENPESQGEEEFEF